jgi:hypothetical protein
MTSIAALSLAGAALVTAVPADAAMRGGFGGGMRGGFGAGGMRGGFVGGRGFAARGFHNGGVGRGFGRGFGYAGAGLAGGLALGALATGGYYGGYYGGYPYDGYGGYAGYGAAGYGGDECYIQRRWVFDQWGNRNVQNYQVCD